MSDKNNESYVVNSFHNYGIKALVKELSSIYYSKDKYIECFKHKELKILGLMWHPERHLPFKNNDKKIITKNIMKLLILASGKGSRLNKLTKKPKCLVNVLNKPIISYLTPSFDLFTQVIFVVGYKSDKIKAHLRNYSNLNLLII